MTPLLKFPTQAIYFDIETRSMADLKAKTGFNYALDDTTEILCSCWVQGNSIFVWFPLVDSIINTDRAYIFDCVQNVMDSMEIYDNQEIHFFVADELNDLLPQLNELPWIAHNCFGFDKHVWTEKTKYWPGKGFVDSMGLFRRVGLPAGLNTAGKYLFDIGKSEGHKTMTALSKPSNRGIHKGRFLPVTPGNIPMLISYCISDVLLLKKIMEEHVNPFVSTAEFEDEVYWLDMEINQKGFEVDPKLSKRMIEIEQQLRTIKGYRVEDIIGDKILDGKDGRGFLRSIQRIKSWLLEEHDIDLPNLRRS